MDTFTKRLESAQIAFNFDDLMLLPGFSETRSRDISTDTRFSTNIRLRTPLVSSPMDTVTEARMAIAMAENGGIGVLHRNMTPEEQSRMVGEVKNHEPVSKNATRGKDGRLAVAAALAPTDIERAKMLSKEADALVFDVAHFHTKSILESAKKIIDSTDRDVIIGSMGTKEDVMHSVKALGRVDGVRAGIGGGSICITTDVTKAGSPTPFAVAQAADAIDELGIDIPIIADGGIRTAGDIALVFALGADSAMLGFGLAGTAECPGETITMNGKEYRGYRGMGSKSAREKRLVNDRYADTGGKNFDEGIEGLVPYKGGVVDVIDVLNSAVKASISYAGAGSIAEMAQKARIARVTGRTIKAEIKR
ncbi:MAG: IMP dehydrogenase [Candidatus Marsarchaeota archaeon]|nr:IMP dehydrogenase [Candidatus Marsarchaeota archaeon]